MILFRRLVAFQVWVGQRASLLRICICVVVLARFVVATVSPSAQEITELPEIGDVMGVLAASRGVAVQEGWPDPFVDAPTGASYTTYNAGIGAIPFRAHIFGRIDDVIAVAIVFDNVTWRARRDDEASVEDCYMAFSASYRMMTLALGEPDLPPKAVGSNNLGQATFTLPGSLQGVLFGSFERAICTVVSFYGSAPTLQIIGRNIR